ncbi:MAG: hypothetical protein IT379_26715, partial [Deltaproteobacteria bacterium]|nr:hypothetical protein [Deltaproteobacteria bacterium]
MTTSDPVRGPELTPYQSDFVRRFGAEVRSGSKHLLLAPPGTGKSFAIAVSVGHFIRDNPTRRVLVLTHALLAEQWVPRLARWNDSAVLVDGRVMRTLKETLGDQPSHWPSGTFVMSIDLAKRPDNLEFVSSANWDLVVVDEADASGGGRRELIDSLLRISPAPALLVTSTGFEPDLRQSRGVTLIDWRAAFRAERTRNQTVGGDRLLTRKTVLYRRTEEEIEIGKRLLICARTLDATSTTVLLVRAASSVSALEETLVGLVDSGRDADGFHRLGDELLDHLRRVETDSRLDAFLRLCRELFHNDRRHVAVFCEPRATLDYLVASAEGVGPTVFSAHGGMTANECQHAFGGFERDGGLLIVTTAASAGTPLNFGSSPVSGKRVEDSERRAPCGSRGGGRRRVMLRGESSRRPRRS